MPVDRDKLWAELEQTDEEEIRARIATGSIYGHDKSPLVKEWLRARDQAREDTVKREEIDIARDAASSARDAADAARDAADEAREANRLAQNASTTAKIALAMAAIATVISIIGIT